MAEDLTRFSSPRIQERSSGLKEGEPRLAFLLDHLTQDWVSRVESQLRKKGMTHDLWRVLKVTSEGGALNIMQLHEATQVPHSTLGRWLHRLESLGYVDLRPDPSDQRSTSVSIAPAGRQLYDMLVPIAERCEREALAGFSAAEEQQLRHYIARMSANLGRPFIGPR